MHDQQHAYMTCGKPVQLVKRSGLIKASAHESQYTSSNIVESDTFFMCDNSIQIKFYKLVPHQLLVYILCLIIASLRRYNLDFSQEQKSFGNKHHYRRGGSIRNKSVRNSFHLFLIVVPSLFILASCDKTIQKLPSSNLSKTIQFCIAQM